MKFIKPQEFHPIQFTNNYLIAFHLLIKHYKNTLVKLKPGRSAMDAETCYSHNNPNPTSPFTEPYHAKPLHPKVDNEDVGGTYTVDDDDSSYVFDYKDEEDDMDVPVEPVPVEPANNQPVYTKACASPMLCCHIKNNGRSARTRSSASSRGSCVDPTRIKNTGM